ncbi:MAG: cell division protein FtsQ/DivIB [Proteobacteria bacterium]|nr:cell division protein FtsQ/DivIB [Pseudomonadota bacterium]
MMQEAVYLPPRSGMRASGRISSSSAQPLKPRNGKSGRMALVIILLLSIGILLIQNIDQVYGFVNRPITKVRIENQWHHINDEDVSKMLVDYMGSGFFNIDVKGVKQVLEKHPWVMRASIKKLWPDSLSLELTEQVAIARWGQSQLLNQKGEIFHPRFVQLTALPALNGPEGTQIQVMEQFQAINRLMFPAGMKLTGLTLSTRGSWALSVNNEMEIAVGRTNVFEKLHRFIDFYTAQPSIQTADYRSVDLRYDNGIAIKKVQGDFPGVAIR